MNSVQHDDIPIDSSIGYDQLRSLVAEACRPIGPYWPMKTFAYYNPIRDFEHLSFGEAVSKAQWLLGARGFLPLEEYRGFFHQGRISPAAVEEGLRRAGPSLPSDEHIQIGERIIHVREVWRTHLVYGLEALDPVLLSWTIELEGGVRRFRHDVPEESQKRIIERTIRECEKCRQDPEKAYLANLWKSVLSVLQLYDPTVGAAPSSPAHSPSLSNISQDDSHSSLTVELPMDRTLGDWLDQVNASGLVESLNNQMIKWVSAFVDEGMAGWAMPSRKSGFFRTWKVLAQEDLSSRLQGISGARFKIQDLPDDPEAVLLKCLQRMAIPFGRWREYLARHLAQMPGWAGFIRWRGDNPGCPAQQFSPIDPTQYLAVRLFYESEMVQTFCQGEWGIDGTLPALRGHWESHQSDYDADSLASGHSTDPNTLRVCRDAWRLFHLAQFFELTPIDIHDLSESDVVTMMGWLDGFPSALHGPVWIEAYEDVYRGRLLKKIHDHQMSVSSQGERPRAQGIFCIDARSESFRRHLEAQGPYETFGYAGFFGVPMSHVAFDRHDHMALCPILLSPKAEVVEVPRPGEDAHHTVYLSGSRWRQLSHHLFHDLKQNPIASFILIDALGVFFSLGLAGKTLLRSMYDSMKQTVLRFFTHQVATQIPVDRQGNQENSTVSSGQFSQGFTLQEQAAFVEGGLRVIGLTTNFGRFVMVCGHGSQTDNNPYFAALDCGACGGSHGDPNARVFSAMANNPEVRNILKDHGLVIPDDTWFLPAKHNTTTDRVALYDLVDVPSTHAEEVKQLAKDLEQAGTHQALERCQRIPGAPTHVSPLEAYAHVRTRSMDWANSRPEWGLSGNAAFLIGRRALTTGLDLGGRVFLHSYDPSSDPEGALLEKIMTAPLIVGELINLTYYFSAVDPWAYGSGSKVIHNVVGGIGVMLGSQSDLQKGLPLQSVNDGAMHYHEPMRLLAIIEAPTDRIEGIIQRHNLLEHLFHNQWMNLVAYDSRLNTFSRYLPNATWESVAVIE